MPLFSPRVLHGIAMLSCGVKRRPALDGYLQDNIIQDQFGAGSEMTKVEPEETVKAVVLLKRVDSETSTNKHAQTGWLAFPRER